MLRITDNEAAIAAAGLLTEIKITLQLQGDDLQQLARLTNYVRFIARQENLEAQLKKLDYQRSYDRIVMIAGIREEIVPFETFTEELISLAMTARANCDTFYRLNRQDQPEQGFLAIYIVTSEPRQGGGKNETVAGIADALHKRLTNAAVAIKCPIRLGCVAHHKIGQPRSFKDLYQEALEAAKKSAP